MLDKYFEGDAMNAVRKSWVNLVKSNQELYNSWLALDSETRFELYNDMDSKVKTLWVELMVQYRKDLEAQGIEPFYDEQLSVRRFSEEHFLDTKQLLENTAHLVVRNIESLSEHLRSFTNKDKREENETE